MKGYWHFIALGIAASAITVLLHSYVYFIGFICWLFYLFYKGRVGKIPLIFSLTLSFCFLLYIPSLTPPSEQSSSSLLNNESITGEIISPPSHTENHIQFIFKTTNSKEKVIVNHFYNDLSEEEVANLGNLAYGAKCQLTGKIEIPNTSRNPGQFDYQSYLLAQGITYQLTLESDFYCEGRKPLDVIYTLRTKLISFVANLLSPETSGWLNALVLGDDSGLNEDVIDLFQRWSLSHILAISGLHIGLITALIYFLLVKLNIVTKETAQTIVILFLPIYAFLAGGAPSVLRASLMGLALLLFAKRKITYSLMDILSIVFISLILLDKYIVYQIGFQFSFLVTFGLLLSRKWLFQTKSSIWQVLKISFIAQMMIVPLQLIYFSTFHPLSIILNSIVVPYFSIFVIPSMFLLLLLSPLFPLVAKYFDVIFSEIQFYVIELLHVIDQYLYFPWIIGDFPIIGALIYYLSLYLMMLFLEKKLLKQAFQSGMAIVALLALLVLKPYLSPIGTVTMLDIGQGDAFIIELPYRKGVFFMDAGATFSLTDFEPSSRVYEQVIKPYLYYRGITEIDAIFLSHEDLDHNGSVPFMIEEMNVKRIVLSPYYVLNEEEQEVAQKNNVAIERVRYRDIIEVNGQHFIVVAPQADQNDPNENSLVLKTELGGVTWLFTGDIGKDVEMDLFNYDQDLAVDVLKVGHHGSNTSTHPRFIQKTKPDYALISVGINNRYGHPTDEVISTLESEQVKILRTDEHGAIQFRFKNKSGTFYKFLP